MWHSEYAANRLICPHKVGPDVPYQLRVLSTISNSGRRRGLYERKPEFAVVHT